jgi:hypothetical protein
VLSESDNDDVDNESYSDFKPAIARKIKVCSICLAVQKVGVPRNKCSCGWDGGGGGCCAWKCRVRKKRVNMIVCKFIVSGAFQQG